MQRTNKFFSFFSMLLVTIAMTACFGSSPERTAEKFLAAAYKGDLETVTSLVDMNEEHVGMEEMMTGKLKMMVEQSRNKANELGGVKKVVAESARYSEDKKRAEVKVLVIFRKDDFEKREEVSLVKKQDTWKVSIM